MNLSDICPNYYIENKEFDCKARLNRENSLSWMKTVFGFANAGGGCLFLGVEDKDFKLIGYDAKEADKEKLYWYNEIKNHASVIPSYRIEPIPYENNGALRFILKIIVAESAEKPLMLKYDGMPMVFVRRDGFTNPATEEEIRAMVLNTNRLAFDAAMTDVDFRMDDFSTYASFCRERANKEVRLKDLEAIRFVRDGKLSNGGLLFSDSYQEGRSNVVCSAYRAVHRGGEAAVTSKAFSGNLISCYFFMMDFVLLRMNQGFIKLSDRRKDIDAYPKRALFEAIINALAHRDYFLTGTQINVDMFPNRLVISSPGSLFEGVGDLAPTYDLASFSSKRRNEVICGGFVYANAMESRGTGFEKIMDEYRTYDKKHQPFIYSKNNAFFIVLPDLTYEDGVLVAEESVVVAGQIEDATRFDLPVLALCYLNPCSIRDITDHLGVSNSTFFRKSVIDNLVRQAYLIETKRGNTAYFLTNSEKVKTR